MKAKKNKKITELWIRFRDLIRLVTKNSDGCNEISENQIQFR